MFRLVASILFILVLLGTFMVFNSDNTDVETPTSGAANYTRPAQAGNKQFNF